MTTISNTQTAIDWTRVNNDVNGNPRYVCHFSNLLPEYIRNGGDGVDVKYKRALKLAKAIGGRKFHNKQYGGGIAFISANIFATEKRIQELLNDVK